MKIVINKCYGGFSVSKKVYDALGLVWDGFGYLCNEDLYIKSNNCKAYRSNECLVKAVEEIGEEKASGACADLYVIEIPDDIEWEIHNYDGMESIHEKHKTLG